MYYDEKTNTWFSSELEAWTYHTTGATWAAEAATQEAEEEAADAWREYDRMEERAGNFENDVDLLTQALYDLMSGKVTTRAGRNALRARLEECLSAATLEDRTMSALLRPERDSRGRVA